MGRYDSNTGTWTDGGVSYSANLDGDVAKFSGVVPYAEADAVLGLEAGNRLTVKLVNPDIDSKADLPSGDICTVIGEHTRNKYTKDAFEDDGSLIVINNVTTGPVYVKVKWVANKETTYKLDLTGIALEEA